VLSIGIFFSLIVTGLASSLPSHMYSGLTAQGVPAAAATQVSHLPPIALLFSAFLGYNPMKQILGPQVLAHLSPRHVATLTSHSFFPHLMSAPFHDGLSVAFCFAIAANVIAAVASALTGGRRPGKLRAVAASADGAAGTAIANDGPVAQIAVPADVEPATEEVPGEELAPGEVTSE